MTKPTPTAAFTAHTLTLELAAHSLGDLLDSLAVLRQKLPEGFTLLVNSYVRTPAKDAAAYSVQCDVLTGATGPQGPAGNTGPMGLPGTNARPYDNRDQPATEPYLDPEPETPAPKPYLAPEPAVVSGLVKEMTPDEARETAIREIQAHFAQHPTCFGEIQTMQKKYGVKMFADVPDGKAHALLADVRLVVGGVGLDA
jgi:hypothetical protein